LIWSYWNVDVNKIFFATSDECWNGRENSTCEISDGYSNGIIWLLIGVELSPLNDDFQWNKNIKFGSSPGWDAD